MSKNSSIFSGRNLIKGNKYIYIYRVKKNDITKGEDIVLNLSGRGDKDINTVADSLGIKI